MRLAVFLLWALLHVSYITMLGLTLSQVIYLRGQIAYLRRELERQRAGAFPLESTESP